MNLTDVKVHNLYLFLKDLQTAYKEISSWQNGLKDADLHQTIKYAVRLGLVTGISSELNAQGELSIAFASPVITKEGNEFILDYEETAK